MTDLKREYMRLNVSNLILIISYENYHCELRIRVNKTHGGLTMLSRLMVPAFENIATIELSSFIDSIACSDQAISKVVLEIKKELFYEFCIGD